MTIAETLMQAVLARLESSPALCDNVRRAHRVAVARDEAPAIYLIDGDDVIRGSPDSDCRRDRVKRFTVAVFVRDDDGASAADTLVDAVNDRLDPVTAYASGATLLQGAIKPDEEIADEDAIRVDMEFEFRYQAPGWSL